MSGNKGNDPAKDSSTRGPMKGVPEDQTPAEGRSGQYTGTSPDQASSEPSQGESQGGQKPKNTDQPSARPEVRD